MNNTPHHMAAMSLVEERTRHLVSRLRMLAEEVESAARYGIPIPSGFVIYGHEHVGASFSATEEEFAAWVTYTEAETHDYENGGRQWSSASVDVNGLPLSFAVQHPDAALTEGLAVMVAGAADRVLDGGGL